MEKQPLEDVSPIKNDDFPASHVSFQGGILLVVQKSNLSNQLKIGESPIFSAAHVERVSTGYPQPFPI